MSSSPNNDDKGHEREKQAKPENWLRQFGNSTVNIKTGIVQQKTENGGPELKEYLSKNRGRIRQVDTLQDTASHERKIGYISFDSKAIFQFYIYSKQEATQAYEMIIDYLRRHDYADHLFLFLLEFADFRKTADDVKQDGIPKRQRTPGLLPDKAPAKWPGARHAKLTDFLREHYQEHIGNGLTMALIKKLDEPLYWAIHYARKTHALPKDLEIPSRPQLLAETLDRFFREGKASLTSKEKTAVARKAERLRRARAASIDNT